MKIGVEVASLDQRGEALEANADCVLLDNMPVVEVGKAVEMTMGRAKLEVSGGITLDTVRELAETGVDFISVGALTHAATAMDICLRVEPSTAS